MGITILFIMALLAIDIVKKQIYRTLDVDA